MSAHWFVGNRSIVTIGNSCEVGLRYNDAAAAPIFQGSAVVRSGTVVYGDVVLGDGLQTGHSVLIREHTTIGQHVTIGTNTVLDGRTNVGDFVKIETGVYISTHVTIGSRVFVGPNAVFTNDRYPLRQRDAYVPEGVTLGDDVTIGANVTLCPGITIGHGSFVAAGAVVTRDVPAASLVVGAPGEVQPLPEKLQQPNTALSWRGLLTEDGDPL